MQTLIQGLKPKRRSVFLYIYDFYKQEVKRKLLPVGKRLRTWVPLRCGDDQPRLLCPPDIPFQEEFKWRYSIYCFYCFYPDLNLV